MAMFLISATLLIIALFPLCNAQLFRNDSLSVTDREASSTLCPAVAECIAKLDKGEKCNILPVPQRSLIPPITDGPFQLTVLRRGVWAYEDGAYNSLILKMGERLAVLDFPDSPASNTDTGSGTRLTDAVEQVLDGDIPKRIDMVYSHDHYDHIGAATRFYNYARSTYADATILVWGTYSTRRVIKASKSKRAVLPNVIVRERGRTLSLGKGLNVRMIMMGGHSGQDLALYIPPHAGEPGIVLYVDVVFPRWSPFLNLALSEDVTAYEEAHLKVMKLDFDIFVGGHVRIGNKQDVRENLQFTRDLLAAAETSISSLTGLDFVAAGVGKTGDPSAPEFGNVWFATIDVVRRLQIAGCYRIILEKWGCRLAGLDITGSSHCFTAVSHVILAA